MTSLHSHLYNIISKTCVEGLIEEDWYYTGITYLIPKGEPKKGSDFRPITCMSNLYKLMTKCVTKVMQFEIESRDLISENQLGTIRNVQSAKEQAMINIALNKQYDNKLKTAWIDVKKAFDSINHDYLFKCIDCVNFPPWIKKFIRLITSKWQLNIMYNNNIALKKSIKKGILQGDSLSPLLFILIMDPLSKRLNSIFPKVSIPISKESSYTSNHLLFIDDLKILAETDKTLELITHEAKRFFEIVGLEMNIEK